MSRPAPGAQGGADSEALSGADLLVRALVDQGIDTVYINPGTDTAPFAHAIEVAASAGRPAPRLVLCPHETVALAAAHAHFAVTGRVQAVFVHVDVGTQNLGSMIHNAARAEAGVLILAGLTPYDETGTVPGSRDATVHWMQDVPDQAGIVRQYVKAAFSPAHPGLVPSTVRRAVELAAAAPSGPVYMTLGREMLMASGSAPSPARPTERYPAGPSAEAIRASVREIRASEHPVLVTSRVGRDPAAVAPFVRLAESIGAPVVDQRERMNFPATHPLAAPDAEAALAAADLVIVVDSPVPWLLGHGGPSADCRVLVVDTDPMQSTMPNWAFPADLRIAATPRLWLEAVVAELDLETPDAVPSPAPPTRIVPALPTGDGRLRPEDVLTALAAHLRDEDRLIDESATSSPAVAAALPRTRPGTRFRSGGSGLGWALGALLGAQIADPAGASLVVVGDGGFLFGAPVSAFAALRRAGVGGLVVVMQNGGYAASSRPVHELFPDPDRAQPPATAFDTGIDVARIAEACGAVGVAVTSPADLETGVATAVAAWRRGELAVIGAQVASPWIG